MGNYKTPQYYSTATQVLSNLIKRLHKHPLSHDTILNINVPNMALKITKRYKNHALRVSSSIRTDDQSRDPHGRAITPLQIDLTRHADIPILTHWLSR